MSLKHNIIANYVSQFYGTVIALVMVPVYVRYMGIEAYGLIGFFTMLQMWFQLLDMGLTPTMARETARYRGGAIDGLTLRRLLRALEGVFFTVGFVGATAMIAGAGLISARWLKAEQIPQADVEHAVMLMAMIVALRWMSGMYRSAISGFERQVWLSGFNIAIATTRFVLVIPLFIFVGASPAHFFSFQLAVAMLELAILVYQAYRLMPAVSSHDRVPWQWQPLGNVLKFSVSIAFTNSVWVALTQTDKLVLSNLLPLTDYAYFTLAVLAASGVTVLAGPISVALQPRLSKLAAAGDDEGLVRVYRNATQLASVVAIPAALVLAFFAEQVLWVWTGDEKIVRNAAPVLTLYALGNGILAIGAFPYYLQVAKGDLKLHLIGNAIFVVLLIPALVWATWRFGTVGAGYAWLGAHLAYFLLWIPRVHDRLFGGLHRQWLWRDVGTIVLMTIAAAAAAEWLLAWPRERLPVAIEIGMLSAGLLAIAASASSWIRGTVSQRW